MSFLKKVFGRQDDPDIDIETPECIHASLVARWDNPDDMGNEELATSWLCTSCNIEIAPAERAALQSAEQDLVRQCQDEKAEVEERLEAEQRAS